MIICYHNLHMKRKMQNKINCRVLQSACSGLITLEMLVNADPAFYGYFFLNQYMENINTLYSQIFNNLH